MKKTMVRSLFLAALVIVLPGCVLINTVLGVVGLVTTGPIQYAGAAYSLGEYTYEYAVNDKTPDEVMVDKVAWLFDEEPTDTVQYAEKTAIPTKNTTPDWDTSIRIAANKASLSSDYNARKNALTRVKLTTTEPEQRVAHTPATVRPVTTVVAKAPSQASQPVRIKQPEPTPIAIPVVQAVAIAHQHEYIERNPDPLLNRLNKMQQAFTLAERMATDTPARGIRYSINQNKNGQTITDINGSWSIRHDVMQSPPPAPSATKDTIPADQSPIDTQTIS